VGILARWARQRSTDPWPQITLQQYVDNILNYQGWAYRPTPNFTLSQNPEEMVQSFTGYVAGAYRSNGVVWACLQARALTFSEAVFKFQQQTDSRPGKLFGTPELRPLETPWRGGSTGDLLGRMSIDADLCGTAYVAKGPPFRPGGPPTLRRLRPDWVTIIAGSHQGEKDENPLWQWDAEPIGYLYHPGGREKGTKPQTLLAEQVATFTPWNLDPEAALIGSSPLAPIVEEILGDRSMSVHKRMYFENGATANLIVTLPEAVQPSQFRQWVDMFESEHEGVMNAYRTIYLGAGADAKAIGANLDQVDFKEIQGKGETRICSALRVEPIIIGSSEGLEAATYSNYGQALRAFADLTARPWWRNAASSLAPLVRVPGGARLWYDDRDIAFLRADATDVADINVKQATAAKLLVDAGFEPDTVADFLAGNDISLLQHSGLTSVQLQPMDGTAGDNGITGNGTGDQPALPAGNGNGNGNGKPVPPKAKPSPLTSKTSFWAAEVTTRSDRGGTHYAVCPCGRENAFSEGAMECNSCGVHWWIKLRRDGHVAVVKTTVSSLSEAQRHILKPYVAKYEERVNADGESLELIKAVISGLLGPGET
jgi:hypothetical protein